MNRLKTMRIVSLAPSITSILLELGARKELVGVTKWCKDVANVAPRPQVGDCWKIDLDQVMRLRPTLLIGSVPFARKTVADILEQPVQFLALNSRSLADIYEDIRTLARIVGRDRRGADLIRKMHQSFAAIQRQGQAFATHSKPRVYCEAWPNPRISSPPWVSELVELAGGHAVVPAGKRVTDDEVARAQPDLIVLAWAATGDRAKPQQALRNPQWKNTPAVQNGRVVVIRDELVNTPGPPLLEGVHALLKAIHPELPHRRKRAS